MLTAPRTRAEEARRIVARLLESFGDLEGCDVEVRTSRNHRIAAGAGPAVLCLTVEIQIDDPDAESTL